MCLYDARSKTFKDNIFGMINVSLNDDPVYFKLEASSSVCPCDSYFPPIDNPDYVKQLRVLTVLNESFKVDLFLYTMSSCFQKTELKENIFKIILLSLKKTVLKENG